MRREKRDGGQVMEQTWRWFGPGDPVTLTDARQAGATGIVNALHELPPGVEWPVEAITTRQAMIEAAGLRWSVVESVNVSEAIKKGGPERQAHIAAYCATLRNLAACGIDTVCYNFMPVLDWLRTDLAYALEDGALALRFEATALAAFDLFVLRRPGAEADWTETEQRAAHARYTAMSESERASLARVVLAGLPGTRDVYSVEYVRRAIAEYAEIGEAGLRENLRAFLQAVSPTAEEVGVRLCVHPDDPPRSCLGLPRIVSTGSDLLEVVAAADAPANGITFCSGSLGARPENDLATMLDSVAERVWFVHLRATRREAGHEQGHDAFHEAPHLEGDVDIVALMVRLVKEERRRRAGGDERPIPFRADHGNRILTDMERESVPGYPAVGRLKGLAELRGVLRAVEALT